MITEKSSTNPESFIEFGEGHRIDLVISHGFILKRIFIYDSLVFLSMEQRNISSYIDCKIRDRLVMLFLLEDLLK